MATCIRKLFTQKILDIMGASENFLLENCLHEIFHSENFPIYGTYIQGIHVHTYVHVYR